MTDRHTHIHRASLAVQNRAKAADLELPPPVCRGIAAAVIDSLPERRWFVGMTHDGQEDRAATALRERGFTVYVPMTYRRLTEGKRVRAEPALRCPGYIFIGFDPKQDLSSVVRSTQGMDDSSGSALITSGDKPVSIDTAIIETLRVIETQEFFRAVRRKKPEPRADLVPGEWVEIIDRDDAFFGKRGIYLDSPRKGMAKVLIGMIPKDIAEIDLKKIEHKEKAA